MRIIYRCFTLSFSDWCTGDRHLSESLRSHKARKRYRAVVLGAVRPDAGKIDAPLGGQDCCSEWKLVQRLQFCLRSAEAEESVSLSLVDLWPHTGRYHQLRRHMSGFGHCIIGDQRHGCEKANAVAIQADVGMQLAAVQVEIPHEPPDQHATGVSHGSEECKES